MKLVLLCLVAVTALMAGTVSHTLELSPQDVVMSQSDKYSVVQLALNDNGMTHAWTTEPGEPLLPVVSGNVLIPAGAEVEDMTVTEIERVEIGTGVLAHPVQPMRPLSEVNSVPFMEPDQAVYGVDAVYPSCDLVQIPAGSKTGFRIAGFLYCPFEYYPASGRLVLVTKARVTVSYREHAVDVVLTPGQRDWAATDVAALVVNPEDVSRMAPPAAEKDAGELDVVIFTSSTMAPELVEFRKWLMRKGYYTEIVRHDTLTTSGRDVQERMRNFLRDKFEDNGLKYAILAGDIQHCPLRYGYLPYTTYDVPAQMYFGDLDGSWDANNNNRFGEMEGDSVDLFQDIYVGRLPLDDAGDAANFLRKDTTYEITPDTGYLDDVILPAEVLWSNIDFHGMIVNTNILRALNSRSSWVVDSGINMGPSNVINAMNDGAQLLHYAGHGSNTAFGSTFNASHIASLTNADRPFISMTMACHCGWFDHASTECLAERMVNATNGGAVSALYNARYGWGAPPTQGPNSNLNCQFFNNFLKGMTQGQAHGLARDFLRNESFSQMTMRWAMYTNTLQGDPTMMMWRETPQTLQALHADSMQAMPQTFRVQVDCGDEAVPGARVAITHMGELIGRAFTNSSGIAYVPIEAVEETTTVVRLTVTAQDLYIYEAEIGVGLACGSPLVLIDHCTVDDLNGRLDPGDETDIYFVVKNKGNLVADSVVGDLTTTSPYVTILQARSEYGTVQAGDTSKGEAYRVSVHRDCPQGHRAEFTLGVVSTNATWTSGCELVVGLPHARGGLWATLDTGDYVCGIFGNGGIGTSQWRGEGYGLIYPKSRQWSTASMMHGSFMMGTDTTWVADNYYGAPDWKVCPLDFQMQESVRVVYPPELGDQEYRTVFSDADHPEPKDVSITHRAYGSANPDHEDFIILEYRIHNNDTSAIQNLYTGVACDFRTPMWNQNDSLDYAGTDSVRQIAYVKSALSGETLAVGVGHIYPQGVNAFANCLSHNTYMNDGFNKAEKMQVMDGTIRQTTGTTRGNYHCVASSGPYTIPVGDSQIVAYIICGGRNVDEMQLNFSTAFAWYSPPVGFAEGQQPATLVRGLQITPRLFTDAVKVRYSLSRAEPIEVCAFGATGRVADRYTFTPAALSGEFFWRPKMAPGVYFVQVGDESEKVLKLR